MFKLITSMLKYLAKEAVSTLINDIWYKIKICDDFSHTL